MAISQALAGADLLSSVPKHNVATAGRSSSASHQSTTQAKAGAAPINSSGTDQLKPKQAKPSNQLGKAVSKALARKAAAKIPPHFQVMLQANIATSGKNKGMMVLELVDRVTHQIYFRLPPQENQPVVARLLSNGLSPGTFLQTQG